MSRKSRTALANQRAQHVRRKRGLLILGVAVVAAFAVGIAALALSDGSPRKRSSPTSVNTANPNKLGGEVSAVEAGAPFSAFSLPEASGATVTNDTLKGKPSIVWFTTSYCVPCQVGAELVAELDRELGGEAFDVLVVFVDPGESFSTLEAWREEFANPDWMVALDKRNALTQKVGLRFLDTKFLLDEDGTIADIDVVQADRNYLERIREQVTS